MHARTTPIDLLSALANKERAHLFAAITLAGDEGLAYKDLAHASGLDQRKAIRHVGRLLDCGLVEHYEDRLRARLSVFRDAVDELDKDVGEPKREIPKPLKQLFSRGRITTVPRNEQLRAPLLDWLAEDFETERRYQEQEVNDLLTQHHDDYAALRRYLVDSGRLQRTNEGVYWREGGLNPTPPPAPAPSTPTPPHPGT